MVGYRLVKRGDVGRDDQRDALAEVAIAPGIRTITEASFHPIHCPFGYISHLQRRLNEVWLGFATGILRRLTELLADGCLSACVLQEL